MADPAQEAYIQQRLKEIDQRSRDPQTFGHSPNFAPIHEARADKFGRIFSRAGSDAATAGAAGAGLGFVFGGGPVGALGLGTASALSAGAVGGGLQAWREFGPESLQIPEEVEPFIAAAASMPAAGAAKVAGQLTRAAPSVANWLWHNRNMAWPLAGSVAGPLLWAATNRDYWPNVGHAGASIAGSVLGLGAIGVAAMKNPSLLRGIPIASAVPSVGGVIDKYMEPVQTPVRNFLGLSPNSPAGRTRLEIDQNPPPGVRTDPSTNRPFGRPIPLD